MSSKLADDIQPQALEAARAFQQSIIDSVAEPIMVIGTDYRVELANRAAREFAPEMSGPSNCGLCYRVSHRCDAPCDGSAHPCPLQQVRESGQPVTVVHEHYQADGESRVFEITASPLYNEDGSFHGIVEVAHDITDRRRAEEALEAAYVFQQTLIDGERRRIARELHDGLAQLLGYVNAKAIAVRLMLRNRQFEAAEKQLLQIEEAARELSLDVREAITDLQVPRQSDAELAEMLRDFVGQFSQFGGPEVVLALAPAAENCPLPAEIRLHLLRITQEALANVRKHSQATTAWVNLQCRDGLLELTIEDNGSGFDPDSRRDGHWPHLGLGTMRERAEVIGAKFDLRSEPGCGTRITVRLSVNDLPPARPKES